MSEVVLDASAVLALLRDEPGADIVAGHMGNAAISAVNLQEVAKEMFREGASCADVRAILGELALDVRAHDTEAAYAAVVAGRQHDELSAYPEAFDASWPLSAR